MILSDQKYGIKIATNEKEQKLQTEKVKEPKIPLNLVFLINCRKEWKVSMMLKTNITSFVTCLTPDA